MTHYKKKGETIVVHWRSHVANQVYIGRDMKAPHGRGKWGNPFKIHTDGTREEVVEKYREWIKAPEQKHLYDRIVPELKGRALGCWCAPKPCHGDILAEIADAIGPIMDANEGEG